MNATKFVVSHCSIAAEMLPRGWPFGAPGLRPFVRKRVVTADTNKVRAGAITAWWVSDAGRVLSV